MAISHLGNKKCCRNPKRDIESFPIGYNKGVWTCWQPRSWRRNIGQYSWCLRFLKDLWRARVHKEGGLSAFRGDSWFHQDIRRQVSPWKGRGSPFSCQGAKRRTKKGGPIGVMFAEHKMGRDLVRKNSLGNSMVQKRGWKGHSRNRCKRERVHWTLKGLHRQRGYHSLHVADTHLSQKGKKEPSDKLGRIEEERIEKEKGDARNCTSYHIVWARCTWTELRIR